VIQGDAETGPVGVQDLGVAGQGVLAPPGRGRLDQGLVLEGDPAVVGEQRADQRPGEVGGGGGLVPPAGRFEEAQSSRSGWWLKLPKPTWASHGPLSSASTRRAGWSNGGPSPLGVATLAARSVTE
jgi:hypothetical protein